ncbi:UbiH/UbiF/VisC/COQ6 family ubiquinone biosynthesis hydroxylase [Gallaecimonas sp. GXIMD4217]|uniref:UbiH/UbiF/VisC/COQ6 family ubiquinone biosynthesis hydroxylase n=1 Tax=Gallaecimonas sp. GXIMD4217 TaxID=3131927 RepID=UPI00311B04BC
MQLNETDVLINGAGMVGAALALMLARGGLRVTLVDGVEPSSDFDAIADTRVSAISDASRALLEGLGAWQHIERTGPYADMHVWEQDSSAAIHFSAAEIQADLLGHIVENRQIQLALWRQLRLEANVSLICPASLASFARSEQHLLATLDNGQLVSARLLVGADGAHSRVRELADMPVSFRDYGHHALVATVQTQEPHQHTAWQVFKPLGPLALLPLWQQDQCSIVWSTTPEEAKALMALDDDGFNQRLRLAFDNRLGATRVLSKRQCFPLRARFARDFVQERIALVGDAAHTIHPLAGQGVNLGFKDAIALASHLLSARALDKDPGSLKVLAPYGRERKTDALAVLAAMGALKNGFVSGNPLVKFARRLGLSGVDRLPPLKRLFIDEARGKAALAELDKLASSHKIFS